MIALIGHGWPVTIHRAMGGPPVILFSDPIPPVAVATFPPAIHELSKSAGTGDIQLGFESLVQSRKAFPLSKHPVSFPGVGGQDGASSGPGGLRAHRHQPMDAQAAAARGLGRTGPKKQKQPGRTQTGPGAARHRAALGTGSQVAGDFSHGTYPHRRGRRAGSAGIRRPDRPRAGARRMA